MNAIAKYIKNRVHYHGLVDTEVSQELEMVVVIPCYNEYFEVLAQCLFSLINAKKIKGLIEVYILINQSETTPSEINLVNENCFNQALHWAKTHSKPKIKFYPIWIKDMEAKKAGVGLARKIAMDQALLRFYAINKNGLIINLDADTVVADNYFVAIENFFQEDKNLKAGGIHFEHPLNIGAPHEIEAIIQYELHLRYFINMQKWACLPFGFQTIGSAMVVRSNAYASLAGMNTRKAGEDFYFLHKFIKTNSFAEINTTSVYPSPRVSDRVPFGTGKAVGDHISLNTKERNTYNPNSFKALKVFVQAIMDLEDLSTLFENDKYDDCVHTYFDSIDYRRVLIKLEDDSNDKEDFIKRFFTWFDAFKFMKYLHHCRDHYYPDISLSAATLKLLDLINITVEENGLKEMLLKLRVHDKAQKH